MNEQKAEKLFNGVTGVGDDLIQEAAVVQTPKRKKTAAWRWGLAAACLCAALLGTAAAAQYLGVRIVDGPGGDEGPNVWLAGGISYYPVDSLSEDVKELDDPFYVGKSFNSWDEIEDFIGVDLMNNPVLDASPAKCYSCHVRWRRGSQKKIVQQIQGRFLAIGSGSLTSIKAIGCYEIGKVNIIVEGHLFTDRMAEGRGDWDERFMGLSFSDEDQVCWEDYTTPSGLRAHILTVEYARFYTDTCEAVFSLNGIPYIIKASTGQGLTAAREALLQVLDGFQV